MTLTDEILNYIIEFKTTNNGTPPTVREIKDSLGLSSTSVVTYHLNKLIDNRRIWKDEHGRIRVFGGKWTYDQG